MPNVRLFPPCKTHTSSYSAKGSNRFNKCLADCFVVSFQLACFPGLKTKKAKAKWTVYINVRRPNCLMQLGSKRCHMASVPCFVGSSEARVPSVPILYFPKRFDSLFSSLETLCVNLSFFLLSLFLFWAKIWTSNL